MVSDGVNSPLLRSLTLHDTLQSLYWFVVLGLKGVLSELFNTVRGELHASELNWPQAFDRWLNLPSTIHFYDP